MDVLSIISAVCSILGAVATIISTCVAVKSKNEAKSILKKITNEQNKLAQNYGHIVQNNSRNNSGIISGINVGEINK